MEGEPDTSFSRTDYKVSHGCFCNGGRSFNENEEDWKGKADKHAENNSSTSRKIRFLERSAERKSVVHLVNQ